MGSERTRLIPRTACSLNIPMILWPRQPREGDPCAATGRVRLWLRTLESCSCFGSPAPKQKPPLSPYRSLQKSNKP